jgi:hypothetical protein
MKTVNGVPASMLLTERKRKAKREDLLREYLILQIEQMIVICDKILERLKNG